MDIRSIGSSAQSGQLIADTVANTGNSASIQKQTATPTQTVNAVTATKTPPTVEQLAKAVKDINSTIQALSQNLEFTIDNDSERVVVKIVDQQTKEVLRQIPTEEALEISKSLDRLQGLLIKQQA
ncbi:MAG: flagellar protein FlaG [Undibacterium sp.]|nr:flagellar protein FlaG [Undibacterium sp.]MDO8702253.1 flagellar protein FlaG [Undibacterium sp.]MDO9193355.1 flagellar protein FlaG [Undibacterium sp.]